MRYEVCMDWENLKVLKTRVISILEFESESTEYRVLLNRVT